MKNKLSTSLKYLSALAVVSLAPQAQAALDINLNNAANELSPTATITGLPSSPAISFGGATPSGSLTGSSGSFSFTGAAADTGDWSLDGSNNITITTAGNVAMAPDGWGAIGGGVGNFSGGQFLTLTFDLTNLTLGAGQSLQLDSFSVDATTTDVPYIVSGASLTTYDPDTALGTVYTVNTALSTGTTIGFSGDGASTAYKVTDLSISVIPEPSSIALLGLAGLAVYLLRRRK